MQKDKFFLRKRIGSFRYAFRGIICLIRSEHNAWIQVSAAGAVILLGFLVRLHSGQWTLVILSIGLVLTAEAFNTCVEKLCDLVHPGPDDRVRFIKDVSAGAVLLASVVAAIVGAIIFLPRIFHHFPG
ncbi:MAG TPA: diacylglycerol kinase family protein [Chitinophagaceae bacterium]|nr:diacylglycerol kinase family protein [Chitinophagaceae bacterium]